MATNDFLVFGGGAGANVITQVTYSGLAARTAGFSSGVAQSAQLNKVWRQSSIMAAVLAQFISDRTGQDAIDDGTTVTLLANLKKSTPGRLLRICVYQRIGGVQMVSVDGAAPTATGATTHTRLSNATRIIGRCQGAGSAGGGAGGAASGNVSMGAPGMSGAYGVASWDAAAFGASQVITVGAAGVPVSNNVGGNGGSSSVGSLMTAPGGNGGVVFNNVPPPSLNGNGGLSSAATGANLYSWRGAGGSPSLGLASTGGVGGQGGASAFGPGPAVSFNANGADAVNPGSGGSGVAINQAGGVAIGGKGGDGIVIIEEYE
ncbi:hypothetical protein [Cupriavidus alkaliphilus]|uniref:Uncharacterized protein n=1 Tax=Cupriavidus alkaliphilus TaxID=942866 RepID=A0A7W4V6M1_9BURK|nr:hypothetical protein [Cupriavidus alkaliphilus]MBB3006052.1 hypothetical protein [Cupriavidus alkaliphilus]